MKKLSVVTLTWDQLHLTREFVKTIKQYTKVPYELIMVDNGSTDGTREYIKQVADKYYFFDHNSGFAHGFNKGIALASGEYIALCNNDTEFPANWFELLVERFSIDPKCGLVFPCYTSGLHIAKRKRPGNKVVKLRPFGDYPSGVVILSKLSIFRDQLKGFNEDYKIASGEDADLCYKTWSLGLNIYVDQRVLIQHVGKGTTAPKIMNWRKLHQKNTELFQQKWAHVIKSNKWYNRLKNFLINKFGPTVQSS